MGQLLLTHDPLTDFLFWVGLGRCMVILRLPYCEEIVKNLINCSGKHYKQALTDLCSLGGTCPIAAKYSSIEILLSPLKSTVSNMD